MSRFFHWIMFLPLLIGRLTPAAGAYEKLQTPPAPGVVRAVLFYSPTCGHCHYVIEEVLPPLMTQYGDRLQIIGVDVSTSQGFGLFEAAWGYYNVKGTGVPFLAVGNQYLVGSADIPQKFPALIESYLAQGGVDWPAIPGLVQALQASQPEATSPPPTVAAPTASSPTAEEPAWQPSPSATESAAAAVATAAPVVQPTFTIPAAAGPLVSATPAVVSGLSQINQPSADLSEKFQRDPVGNGLAVLVLLGMMVTLIVGLRAFWRPNAAAPGASRLALPVLCLVGVGVAGYLAYVETTQSLAVCGPVGDCNTVQQSEYARLFGVLPVGVLGISGYVAILLAWAVARVPDERTRAYAAMVQAGMTTFGLLFSMYLTFLEPFVIGATCAWCLTSAVITTALFWLSLPPARVALRGLQGHPGRVLSTP